MIRLKKCSNLYRYLTKYNSNRNLTSISSRCNVNNPLIKVCEDDWSHNKDNTNRSQRDWWKNTSVLALSSIGIGLVFCDSHINNSKINEKRFFRSVQYGIEHEVKRYA